MPFKKASGYRATCVMAAIDLERGLEHSGRRWGQERPELMDNFDSEMQEWEDQLQDIQKKIEEVRFHIKMLDSFKSHRNWITFISKTMISSCRLP